MAMNKIYKIGTKVGPYTILEEIGNRLLIRCRCGVETSIYRTYISYINKKGLQNCIRCKPKKLYIKNPTTRLTYSTWLGMKNRCSNPNNNGYKYYGGKGVRVCDRWKESFENFLNDMGTKPVGMSIDRIDSNGDYEPSNCKWSTREEQNKNRKFKYQRAIDKLGDDLTIEAVADMLDVDYDVALKGLIRNGVSVKIQNKYEKLMGELGDELTISAAAEIFNIDYNTAKSGLVRNGYKIPPKTKKTGVNKILKKYKAGIDYFRNKGAKCISKKELSIYMKQSVSQNVLNKYKEELNIGIDEKDINIYY